MAERHRRRAFIARSARLAAGAATLSLVGSGVQAAVGPAVASAHNVSGNQARAGELYSAMQTNYYLGTAQGSLYNETSPRAKEQPIRVPVAVVRGHGWHHRPVRGRCSVC
jgi:hypothetical protein